MAKAGDEFLTERRAQLSRFQEALPGLRAYFQDLENNFLTLGQRFLSIRIFNKDHDLEKFYLLDFDDARGKHQPVHPPSEHRKFLDRCLGPKTSTLDLLQFFEREGNEQSRLKLRVHATERFQADFETCRKEKDKHRDCGRFVEVLKHPEMQKGTKNKIARFVGTSLPMLRRSVRLGGDPTKQVKKVYLGLPYKDREPYVSFEKQVRELLVANEYPDPAPFVTDDPTSVQLFVETYAFPLPSADIIVGDCHEAYYDFYHTLQRTARENRLRIPLELCSNWEGEFEDLKLTEEEGAKTVYLALKILCLGPVLGVVRLASKEHRREYSYLRWVPPAAVRETPGNKRQTIEFLRRDKKLRDGLLDYVQSREEKLKAEVTGLDFVLLKYFWALSYMRFGLFQIGTPENAIVEDRLKDLAKFLDTKGLKFEDLGEMTKEEQIERCMAKLGDDVEWVDDFPILKALSPLVLERD